MAEQRRIAMLILSACLAALPAAARAPQGREAPGVRADLERSRIYLGDQVMYRVMVSNVDEPKEPDLGAFTDFEVKALPPADNSSFSVQIINGRRSEVRLVSTVYRYLLTPKRAGRIAVPPALVRTGSEELRTESFSLEVIGPEEQDIASLRVEIDRERAYVLQPFTVTLKVLVKALPPPHAAKSPVGFQEAPALEVPWAGEADIPEGLAPEGRIEDWLQPLLSRGTGFTINAIPLANDPLLSFFDRSSLFEQRTQLARIDLASRRVERPDAAGHPAGYVEYTLGRTFRATRPGTYAFGPVKLKGAFAEGLDAQGGFRGREVFTLAPAKTIEVLDAPAEGRPDGYAGAVGAFAFAADVRPRRAAVGDPMTLTITVTGTGTLDRTFAPDLTRFEEVTAAFKVYEATEETKGQSRIFTYGIRPLNSDVTEFPSLPLAYFDVEAERYVTVRTGAVPLEVEPADALDERAIVAGGAEGRPGRSLEAQREGIFADVMDLSTLRDETVRPAAFALLLGGMLAAYGAAFIASRAVRSRLGDPAAQRRRAAAGRARQQLREAGRLAEGGRPADGIDAVRSGLTGFAADLAGVKPEGLTPGDLRDLLVAFGLDGEKAQALARALELCDAARYGLSAAAAEAIPKEAAAAFEAAVLELRRSGRLR